MHRRTVLAGLASVAYGAVACRRSSGSRPFEGWRELSFESTTEYPDAQRALVLAPARGLPLLVALHGRGESGRGLDVGARAWRDDYFLDALDARLHAPPVTSDDLRGAASTARLSQVNGSLATTPYAGVCVACPYTPDLPDRSPQGARPFGRFVVERLVARVRAESGCLDGRSATGIDGVSMGGRLALFVGLSHPETFGAVGALQPALRADEAPLISRLARTAMERAEVRLRLVSSDGDPFLPAVRAVAERLRADGITHELLVVPGNHDYDWNRGPGGMEMLLWHDRVLRGVPPP